MTAKLLSAFLVLTLLLAACKSTAPSTPIEATPPSISSAITPAPDCAKTAMQQLELNQCAAQQAMESGKKLDQLLGELQTKYYGERWAELQSIEKDWQALRDRSCAWQRSLFDSGSIAPMEYSLCITRYNNQRIQELSIFLCDGAGMTGPCPESQKYAPATAQP